jgi:quinol monooxygenase YgiN
MQGKRVTILARIKAKSGMEQKVKEELLALVGPARLEEGCINYELHQVVDDNTLFVFYENWRSKEDLDKHMATAHFQTFATRAHDLLAESVEITLMEMIS